MVAKPGQTTTENTESAEEDKALIRAFLDGDEVAFTRLVTRYRKQVYAVAYRFTRNAAEADDLTQDTFVKAYQHLDRFRMESSFKTWLLRITTNLSINMTKSGRIARDSGEAPEEGAGGVNGIGLDHLLQDEQRKKLHAAIRKLPPKQKEALMLKTFENMTCEQVAGVMKCSVGTVKANVFNALKRLKSILNPGA